MNDVELVDVFDSGDDLLEKLAGFCLFEFSLVYNVVEKFSARGVLHD
jgi:hypothetical protein